MAFPNYLLNSCAPGVRKRLRQTRLHIMKTKTHLILAAATLAIALSNTDALGQAGRQETAIWIRDNPSIILQTYHPSGISDPASTARQNIVDTANCQPAKTSGYSDVGVTSVWLHTGTLNCMKAL